MLPSRQTCSLGLLDAVDHGDTAMLVLLDLSATFDSVDRGILLERLQVTFDVDNSALAWFRSYLAGRRQMFCPLRRHLRPDTGVGPWTDTLYYFLC